MSDPSAKPIDWSQVLLKLAFPPLVFLLAVDTFFLSPEKERRSKAKIAELESQVSELQLRVEELDPPPAEAAAE